MAHTLILGYKDNPTIGTDDCISLADAPGATGVKLNSLSFGQPGPDNALQRLTRTITIKCTVVGSSYDDAITRYRNIVRYIEQTKDYIAQFGGNLPARSDGSWFSGSAAVLTYKNNSATNKLYFNVISGSYSLDTPATDNDDLAKQIMVTISLYCEAAGRGDRVQLNNGCASGDFEPPFAVDATLTARQQGWTLANSPTLDNTLKKFGTVSLAFTSSTQTATSPAYLAVPTTGNYITASVWIAKKSASFTGSIGFKLQVFNLSVWADTASVATYTDTGFTQNVFQLKTLASVSITNGFSYRVVLSAPTTGSVNFDGVSMLFTFNTTPTIPNEYLTSGATANQTYCRIYNVQGDVPCTARYYFENTALAGGLRILKAGLRKIDAAFELPLSSYFFTTGTGVSDTTMFFGRVGTTSSGASTVSNYSALVIGQFNLDKRPRRYRAFLVYAANDTTGITSVEIDVANPYVGPTRKKYTQSLPQTYTGATVPTSAQYRIWELGDFFFPAPNSGEIDSIVTPTSGNLVSITHSNNANRNMGVAGVIFLPIEGYFAVDLNTAFTANYGVILGTESTAPNVGVGIPTATAPLNSYDTNAIYTGGEFYLRPNKPPTTGANPVYTEYNLIEYFGLTGCDTTNYPAGTNLFTYTVSMTMRLWVEYTPRYLYMR